MVGMETYASFIIEENVLNWDTNYSIFAKREYLELNAFKYGWLHGYQEDKLKFILPYKIFKKAFFYYVLFTTASIKVDKNASLEDEISFLNEVIKFLKNKKIDFIVSPPNYAIFNVVPLGSKFCEFGSYLVDLTQTEKELWDNLHQKHRNVIRNAQKSKVKIERGFEYFEVAYDLYAKTLLRSRLTPMPKERVYKIIDSIKENVEIFVAFYEDVPQGAAIIPYSSFSAYYIYGGSIEKPLTGAVNLLHWEAMLYFKNLAVKYYDFVGARLTVEPGSKYEGLQRFKERFGGRLYKGYIWKIALNKFKFNIYRAIQFVMGKAKPDIIDQLAKNK